MSYVGVPPFGQTVRTITEVTATAGQTAFTPSGGYLPGYVDVSLNGIALSSADFTATDGTTVTLTAAAAVGDEFRCVAYWPVSLMDTYRKGETDALLALKAPTASPTFTGNVTLGSSVLTTPTGSAPSYTCRAWVNFNGTGTVAIRASGNVSSITDNGTGDYTLNFTSAMADANYGANVTVRTNSGSFQTGTLTYLGVYSTTACRVSCYSQTNGTSAVADTSTVNVAIFR